MSSLTADRLYQLLPAVHRIRDAQQGQPLRALLAVLAQEFQALEENLDQLYDDQFIETCAEWVAPYIGDLIGYRPLHTHTREAGTALQQTTQASPRAEVAHTIAYRRRKGTAAMLEQLARDVTDWPAHAAEFFEQLATTQYINHTRLHALATANLRDNTALLQQGGAFNRLAHTAEMRRPEAGSGRYNITSVGIFLWRLQAFALSNIPLTPNDPTADPVSLTGRRMRFNPLGADQLLFRLPVSETQITQLAEPVNVPAPIQLRQMAQDVGAAQADPHKGSDYGDSLGRSASLVLSRENADPTQPPVPLPIHNICVCDLRDVPGGWAGEATLDPAKIAIDPRLGRVLVGSTIGGALQAAGERLLCSFHSGFSRPLGGGTYERALAGALATTQSVARRGEALQPHLDAVRSGGRLVIDDSFTYSETPVLHVDGATADGQAGVEVVVTARNGARPLIVALGDIVLDVGPRGRLVLQGLVIAGGPLRLAAAVDREPRHIVLQHCTLVPGRTLAHNGSPVAPGAPSLVLDHPFATLTLDHCISGPLHTHADAELAINDTIVDGGAADAVALQGITAGQPGAGLTVRDSTVVGQVHTQVLTLASNTLFVAALASSGTVPAPVWAERKQEGCVRYSFVPQGSLVPRRFHCLPSAEHPGAQPQFTSLRYGDPGYAQLRPASGAAVLQGADDEGEIGVMHALYQPQREANLRIRLDEYLRFGLHAGIFYVT
jgi:hypothetical protein